MQEYSIVNWQLQTLEIYHRTDAQLPLVVTLLAGDTLTSQMLLQKQTLRYREPIFA